MIAGFWLSRCVYIAAKLGLADLVQDSPKTPAELAALTGTRAAALARVLRALASTLKNCHRAMPPAARLFVIEAPLSPREECRRS